MDKYLVISFVLCNTSDEKNKLREISGSITRASCIDDVRSQTGHYSSKARSIADGQSQHSFSNNSTRYFSNTALASNLVSTRPGRLSARARIFSVALRYLIVQPSTLFNYAFAFQNYGNRANR